MPKQVLSAQDARAALQRGVDAVANPVKTTLGPRGRNVMLDRRGQPIATRDGVTVAKEIHLANPFEDMGAAYAREVADAAVTEAGDGTTTASVLLQAIVTEGMKLVQDGLEPLQLADGIAAAAAECLQYIRSHAVPATPEMVEQVAIISTHGDVELGRLIAETTLKVGQHGVVELQESRTYETHVEHLKGFYFERGWTDQLFANDHTGSQCVLNDPYILLSERIITGAGSPDASHGPLEGDYLYKILLACVQARRPLLILSEDLVGDAKNLFTANVVHGGLAGIGGCFVKLPGFGETRAGALRDLQIAVGAKRIHSAASTRLDDQLSSFTLDDLGTCRQAIISPERTTLIDGGGSALQIQERQKQLLHQSSEAENPFLRAQLDHRIARLTGGVAILRVGGESEPAMIEKKARAEDAIHACRGAVQQGVVPGGGTALLRAAQNATDRSMGGHVLLKAMREPALQIARNAGCGDPEAIVKITETSMGMMESWGYEAAQGVHCDLYQAGVVDPAKVVMVALNKASSIGALLLTTEVLITDLSGEPVPALPHGAMRLA